MRHLRQIVIPSSAGVLRQVWHNPLRAASWRCFRIFSTLRSRTHRRQMRLLGSNSSSDRWIQQTRHCRAGDTAGESGAGASVSESRPFQVEMKSTAHREARGEESNLQRPPCHGIRSLSQKATSSKIAAGCSERIAIQLPNMVMRPRFPPDAGRRRLNLLTLSKTQFDAVHLKGRTPVGRSKTAPHPG